MTATDSVPPPASPALTKARVGGRRRRSPMNSWGRGRTSLFFVFLVLPFSGYLFLVVYPFIQAMWYSLTSWSGFSPEQDFVGLKNYVTLSQDQQFHTAVLNNFTLLFWVPIITLFLSFALAAAVTFGGRATGSVEGVKNAKFYSAISFFPYVVPGVVVALIWGQVYDPNSGLLNGILKAVGLKSLGTTVWLGDPKTALPASMVVMMWALVGFYTIIFVAAIRSIPMEMFEAARIDGAGRFRQAVSIALPNVLSPARTAYIYIGIAALDAFVPMALLNPTGGPDFSTLVMTQEIYQTAFRKGKFGLACAMGVMMAVFTFLFVGILDLILRLINRRTS